MFCAFVFFSSRTRHTSGALWTVFQTCALPIFPRMPILPDLKCFHKNWRPHGPESVDLGEPTNHASRSGKNKVRLEASCQRHEKAARDDPDPIGMDLVEESAFDGTM